MTRIYFDGSYRPAFRMGRWAVLVVHPDGRLDGRHGTMPKCRTSTSAEQRALARAIRVARDLEPPVRILGDEKSLIEKQEPIPGIEFQWIPRGENHAHLLADIYPIPAAPIPFD